MKVLFLILFLNSCAFTQYYGTKKVIEYTCMSTHPRACEEETIPASFRN